MRAKIFVFLIGLFFLATAATAATTQEAIPKEYDGIWFLGFNLHKDIFSGKDGLAVRQAFAMTIDQKTIRKIAAKTFKENIVAPSGIIPPGMLGYDSGLENLAMDLKKAKTSMRQAGYPMNDKRIKSLTLLHTGGKPTIEIARTIRRNLISIGVNAELVQIDIRGEKDQLLWENELKSGVYHLFLMGYKAEIPKKTFTLLYPLFHSQGGANMTFYHHKKVDLLLEQLLELDPKLVSIRERKLKEINNLVTKEIPVIPFYYITKL